MGLLELVFNDCLAGLIVLSDIVQVDKPVPSFQNGKFWSFRGSTLFGFSGRREL